MKITVKYKVSEDVIKRELIATGTTEDQKRASSFELEEFSSQARTLIVDMPEFEASQSGHSAYRYFGFALAIPRTIDSYNAAYEYKDILVNSSVVTIEEIEKHLPQIHAATKEAAVEYKKLRAAKRAEKEENDRQYAKQIAATNKGKEKAEEEREARKEAAKAEKGAWIEEHGSDHLQRAFPMGYDCQRLYVEERAKKEFPGFKVDFDDFAEAKDRSCPSSTGLDVVDEILKNTPPPIYISVQWLTKPVSEEEYNNNFECGEGWEEREAVIIEGFLGKYWLVKVVK